jgi:hypothetical protein
LGIVWFECKGWIKGYFLSSILCPFGHLSAIFEDFNITCSSGIGTPTVVKDKQILTKKHRPGELVPESGVYRVTHDEHRLMHEAMLLAGSKFPVCKRCNRSVRFELRRAVKNPTQIVSGYHAILEDYPDTEPFPVM